MPKTVQTRDNPLNFAAQGLAGAFSGMAEGAQINVERGLKERELGTQEKGLNEQIRTNTIEQQLAVKQLAVLQEQNLLDRNQRDELTRLQEGGLNTRQGRDIDASKALQNDQQEHGLEVQGRDQDFQLEVQSRGQTFEGEQQRLRIVQAESENRRNNATQAYGYRLNRQSQAESTALAREEFRAGEVELVQSRDVLERYGGDWGRLDTPNRQQASLDLARQIVGEQRWTGSGDVPAASDEEKANALKTAAYQLASQSTRERQFAEVTSSRARRLVQEEYKLKGDDDDAKDRQVPLDQVFDFTTVDPQTGMSPVNKNAFKAHYGDEGLEHWEEVEDVIMDMRLLAEQQRNSGVSMSQAQRTLMASQFTERLNNVMSSWRGINQNDWETLRDAASAQMQGVFDAVDDPSLLEVAPPDATE